MGLGEAITACLIRKAEDRDKTLDEMDEDERETIFRECSSELQ